MPMAEQVSRAIAWAWSNAESFGGDRDRFFVSAHSSGAHLAACALSRGWRANNLPPDFCKGALLVGGMYDLEPVRRSARSAYVKFTDEMEEALSAQRHIDGINTPLILAHGTCETPEFQRQSRDFFAALKAKGKAAELLVAEGYNHFELFETMANPYRLRRPRAAAADGVGVSLKRHSGAREARARNPYPLNCRIVRGTLSGPAVVVDFGLATSSRPGMTEP